MAGHNAETQKLPSKVIIAKPELQGLIAELQRRGHRVVGPRVESGAVVYSDLESTEQLPIGVRDHQDAGEYRLEENASDYWFDFAVGPHSLKDFLFPPQESVLEMDKSTGQWTVTEQTATPSRLAVIGPRACDLRAMRIQDRVFIDDKFTDSHYYNRRTGLFVVAINCRRATSTCFCHSAGSGPECTDSYDLLLTELSEAFVVQIGSSAGQEVIRAVDWRPCDQATEQQAQGVSSDLLASLKTRVGGRELGQGDVRELLINNLDHARWDAIAERCLACANCTMVCPTCFCSHVEDVSSLDADRVRRERSWASCFTPEHSAMSSGVVRSSTAARYRQWLTHKLATWHDQFGSSGCVGCGRCITWCPVGIDLTEEVQALREVVQ